MPPEDGKQAEYLPLGVWAMVQEEKGDAYMFFQISIDKNGVVTGAFKNLLSGETSPISGQVDKKTQRVAWKIGSNNTVIETGLQNLTQDVASCLVHFGHEYNADLAVSAAEKSRHAERDLGRYHTQKQRNGNESEAHKKTTSVIGAPRFVCGTQ